MYIHTFKINETVRIENLLRLFFGSRLKKCQCRRGRNETKFRILRFKIEIKVKIKATCINNQYLHRLNEEKGIINMLSYILDYAGKGKMET